MANEQMPTWLKSPEQLGTLVWPVAAGFLVALLNFFGFYFLQGRRYVLGTYLLDRPPLSYANLLSGAGVLAVLLRTCLVWVIALWIVVTIVRRLLRLFSENPESFVTTLFRTHTCGWLAMILAIVVTRLAQIFLTSGLNIDGLILKPYLDIHASVDFLQGTIPDELKVGFPLTLVMILLLSWYLLRYSVLSRPVKALYLIWTLVNVYGCLSTYAMLESVYQSNEDEPVVTFSNMDRFVDPNSTSLLVGSDSKLYAIFTTKPEAAKDASGKETVNLTKTIVYVKRDDVKWLKVLRQEDLFKLAFPESVRSQVEPRHAL